MITRLAEQAVRDAIADTPVVMVHGPRQAGKSTLVQAIGRELNARMVTLDDWNTLDFAQRDPAGFLSAQPGCLIIDEIQRAPGLLLAMKADVDRDRRAGRFLLTGSANVLALPKVADSLAGRMEIVDLYPLSEAEIEGRSPQFIDRLFNGSSPSPTACDDLISRVSRGGFPEPHLRTPKRRDAWFQSYVRSLLERDVRDLANIEGLTQLPRLLRVLAARSGDTINVAAMSRETGIAATTLTRYLDLLRALFLLVTLPPWTSDRSDQLVKSPKGFVVDTALLLHLLGLDAVGLLSDSHLFNNIVRNFTFMELTKHLDFAQTRAELFHLRTIRQREVDFVIEASDGRIAGIQVRAGATVSPADGDGLRYLQELAGDRFARGIVLTTGPQVMVVDPLIEAWPLSSLWS